MEGVVDVGGSIRELAVSIDFKGQKRLALHQKQVNLADFIGNLHVLAFTQEHMKVVRGGPSERRAFLDRAMITAYPGHVQRLAGYARALKQRNHLLRSALSGGKRVDGNLLDTWDEQLVRDGTAILSKRSLYVEELRQELKNPPGGGEVLEIKYISTTGAGQGSVRELEDEFRSGLRDSRNGDIRKGYTHVGPHRDDLGLKLNGKSLSDFGSAGQQRSCLVSLYFAQMEIHRKYQGQYPVFLMDDVDAELDDRRLRVFVEHITPKTQTFLTTAKERIHPAFGTGPGRFLVRGGSILPG